MHVQPGDIIGFLGHGALSQCICCGTFALPFWPFYAGVSHVGIIGSYKRQLYLFESTTLCDLPCAIKGHTIKGTQAHRLEDRLAAYHGRVYHYPLLSPLYADEKKRLNRFLLDTLGRPYDAIGARRSGDGFWFLERWSREDQLARIYCSEWVAAAHAYIRLFQTDDIGKWSPNAFIRAERKQGIIGRRTRLKANQCSTTSSKCSTSPKASLSGSR